MPKIQEENENINVQGYDSVQWLNDGDSNSENKKIVL